jgi:hypothetical protein
MPETNKCSVGSALLVGLVGFLGATAGGVAGSLITFYVLEPAREARAAVNVGVQGAKEGINLLKEVIPKPAEALAPVEQAKKDPNDKSDDPVEAARYFFDNIWAERQEAAGNMAKSSYNLESAFNFLKKDPLPRREKALEQSELKEVPGIDSNTRIYSWTPTTAKGTKIDLRVIIVRTPYKPTSSPFWWQVERIDVAEATKAPEGAKK